MPIRQQKAGGTIIVDRTACAILIRYSYSLLAITKTPFTPASIICISPNGMYHAVFRILNYTVLVFKTDTLPLRL